MEIISRGEQFMIRIQKWQIEVNDRLNLLRLYGFDYIAIFLGRKYNPIWISRLHLKCIHRLHSHDRMTKYTCCRILILSFPVLLELLSRLSELIPQ